MTNLSGKTALVTGASRGIGRASALALANSGAQVLVHYSSGEKEAAAVVAHIRNAGGKAEKITADLRAPEGPHALAERVRAVVGGRLDILIANAGVLWLGPIESTSLKRWQLCMNVNLTGVFLVTKAVIPHVKARGGGSLIAITTTGVGMVEHGSNAYWVSKAGAERLYLGLAADLKADNIAVNCLSPSRVVLTEGWQAGGGGMEIPPEMVEPPEAMANAAVLLAQQDASGITGTIQRSEELTS